MKKFLFLMVAVIMANVAAAQIYDRVGYYYDGLALVEGYTSANGWSKKYGYVNEYNKLVIPLKYEDAGNFCEGIAAVKIGRKCGYINTKGAAVTPLIYDEVYNFQEGFGKVGINGKYGCVNKSGKLVIPCKYEQIYLRNNAFNTQVDGKWYLFDKTGRNIVPQGYNYGSYLGKDNNGKEIWCVEKDGKYGAINFDSKIVIECKYDKLEGMGNCGISLKSGDKYGCMLLKNKKIIPIEYDKIESESSDDGSCHIKAYKGKYFTYYNSDGERELPGLYSMVKDEDHGGYIVENESGKYAYLGQYNKISDINFEYDELYFYNGSEYFSYKNRWLYFAKKDGKWGFVKRIIDKDKHVDDITELIPCEYDKIQRIGTGNIFFLYKDGKRGIIDTESYPSNSIPCIYDELDYQDGYIIAKKNGKYGVISSNNNRIINDFSLDKKPVEIHAGLMMEINGKTGVKNLNGNIVVPFVYEIFEPSNGMIRVKKDNAYSYVTEDYEFGSYNRYNSYYSQKKDDKDWFIGQYFYFTDAKDFHEGVAAVKQGSLWGYASKGFSWVIMPKFDEAGDFKDGKALVRKGKKEYYIGKDGKKIK